MSRRMSSGEEMCYVGVAACGCVRAAAVDTVDRRRDTAKDVAGWIRNHLTVERRTVAWVRENMKRCPHWRPGDPGSRPDVAALESQFARDSAAWCQATATLEDHAFVAGAPGGACMACGEAPGHDAHTAAARRFAALVTPTKPEGTE